MESRDRTSLNKRELLHIGKEAAPAVANLTNKLSGVSILRTY